MGLSFTDLSGNDASWLAIDEQFLLTWDASGKPIGNWNLTRDVTESPKTLRINDILTGDPLSEGNGLSVRSNFC